MIKVLFFNEDFKRCGKAKITYKNLTWNREYYECGKFTLELHKKYLFPDAKYVYVENRPEVGLIQRIQLVKDGQNENVLLSGFFCEASLNDEIIHPTFFGNGDLNTSIQTCFNTYKGDLPITEAITPGTETASWQATGDELGRKFYELLKPVQKSYKVFFDKQSQSLNLSIYQGVDRKETVVFSAKRKNVTRLQADLDESNYKNYFVIAGSGQGADRIAVVLNLSPNDGKKKKRFINAASIAYDPDEMTLAQYEEMLLQYGLEKAASFVKINNITIIPNSIYKYREHYDLGDKVTIYVEELNINFEVRIVSVHEVVKNGTHTVTLVFGEKKLSTIKKARLYQ